MKRRHKPIPDCPPPHGGAVHRTWMMRAAWVCRHNGMDEHEACKELHARITRRPDPANEIETAVQKVFRTNRIIVSGTYGPSPGHWPSVNRERIEAVASGGQGVGDLIRTSAVQSNGDRPQTAKILQAMFPGDPLLCVGSKYEFFTEPLSVFSESAHTFEQIVPSPMLAKYGTTRDGKRSEHTLEATGPRRFLVVEGDKLDGQPIPKDTQAAVLLHLAERAPLALVVDSAGKSLHGWFFCAGVEEASLRRFFGYAVSLGADEGLWTRSQFARMPDGRRENGRRQSVLFFNPEVIK